MSDSYYGNTKLAEGDEARMYFWRYHRIFKTLLWCVLVMSLATAAIAGLCHLPI